MVRSKLASRKNVDGEAPRKTLSKKRNQPAAKAVAKKLLTGHLLLSSRMGALSTSGDYVGNVTFCAACHCDVDGEEDHLTCDNCKNAYLCKRCIKEDRREGDKKDAYVCMVCCTAAGHPYPFELNSSPIRHPHGPQVQPFGIILLWLDTLTLDCATIATAVLQVAKAYFPVGVDEVPAVQAFFHCFSFALDDDDNISYDHDLNNKLDDFIASCEKRGVRSFFLLLQTHSDRVDGGFFVSPNIQADTDTLLRLLLTPNTMLALQRAQHSVLLLVACGHTLLREQSFNELKQSVEMGIFKSIVAFSQPRLQPFLALPFAVNFTTHLLFSQNAEVRWDTEQCTQHALVGQENLGAHSSVVLFLKDVLNSDGTQKEPFRVLEWLWAPSSRPNGMPIVCGKCSSTLRSTNRKGKKGILMACEGCDESRWVQQSSPQSDGQVNAVTPTPARWVERNFNQPQA